MGIVHSAAQQLTDNVPTKTSGVFLQISCIQTDKCDPKTCLKLFEPNAHLLLIFAASSPEDPPRSTASYKVQTGKKTFILM